MSEKDLASLDHLRGIEMLSAGVLYAPAGHFDLKDDCRFLYLSGKIYDVNDPELYNLFNHCKTIIPYGVKNLRYIHQDYSRYNSIQWTIFELEDFWNSSKREEDFFNACSNKSFKGFLLSNYILSEDDSFNITTVECGKKITAIVFDNLY